MPSLLVVSIATSLAICSLLAALVVLSRRQDAASTDGTTSRTDDRPPGSGGRPSPTELPPVLAACLDEATRVRARNSREEAAVDAVRDALDLAVDAAFAVEMSELLQGIEGIEVLDDVRVVGTTGASINHLVVAPVGVVIVESMVRTVKVVVDREAVHLGRGRETRRELKLDEVTRWRSTIAGLVEAVPVHGVMVLRDALTLPAEIREGEAQVKGVRLMTPSGLTAFLSAPGELDEVALVAALLRDRFRPALTASRDDPDRAQSAPAPGPPPIPPTSTANRVSTSIEPQASIQPQSSPSSVALPSVPPLARGRGPRPGPSVGR
jgi:hypothetical protein